MKMCNLILCFILAACEGDLREYVDSGLDTLEPIDAGPEMPTIGFAVGNVFPDICLQNQDGETTCIHEYGSADGADYLAVEWSSKQCAPCERLSQAGVELKEWFADRDLNLGWVTLMDPVADCSINDIKNWHERNNCIGPILLDADCDWCNDWFGEQNGLDGASPTTFYLRPDMTIAFIVRGFFNVKSYSKKLDTLLGEMK